MNTAYVVLLLAAVALVLTHVVPSSPAMRARMVNIMGENAFKALYSLVAIACIGVMVWAFNRVPQDLLWYPGAGLRHIPLVVMPVALFLAVAGALTRNPTSFGMEDRLQAETPARGIVRITRHPFLWATILWAISHIVANGDLGSLLFFGGFLGLAIAGMIGLDRKRAARFGDQWQRFTAVTSSLPFLAVLTGRNRLIVSEIGWMQPVIALALYAALLTGHRWLFGVTPY
jgi:uncharacterized membrane protein